MDPSPEGFPSPDWAGVFGEPPCLLHPLRLQLLCGGLGAPEHFLDQQQIPFVADPYVDNAVFLAPALQSLYGQGHHGTVLFTEPWLQILSQKPPESSPERIPIELTAVEGLSADCSCNWPRICSSSM